MTSGYARTPTVRTDSKIGVKKLSRVGKGNPDVHLALLLRGNQRVYSDEKSRLIFLVARTTKTFCEKNF